MPLMSGVEVATEVRKMGCPIYIVGCTGNALREDQVGRVVSPRGICADVLAGGIPERWRRRDHPEADSPKGNPRADQGGSKEDCRRDVAQGHHRRQRGPYGREGRGPIQVLRLRAFFLLWFALSFLGLGQVGSSWRGQSLVFGSETYCIAMHECGYLSKGPSAWTASVEHCQNGCHAQRAMPQSGPDAT